MRVSFITFARFAENLFPTPCLRRRFHCSQRPKEEMPEGNIVFDLKQIDFTQLIFHQQSKVAK